MEDPQRCSETFGQNFIYIWTPGWVRKRLKTDKDRPFFTELGQKKINIQEGYSTFSARKRLTFGETFG